MTRTIYTCDGCGKDYESVTLVPIKRGEVIKVAQVHIKEIQHPKDVPEIAFYIPGYTPFLDLCQHCECVIRTILNVK